LVGSGNLSAGGLRSNVECFLYTDRFKDVGDLLSWFDGLFSDPNISTRLRPGDIEDYEVHFNAAQKVLRQAKRREEKARKALKTDGLLAEAIRKAKRYFQSRDWREDRTIWYPGARRIRNSLRYPRFDFDRSGWDGFYRERTMGHLIEVHKNKVFRKRRRLQMALRHLVNENMPVEKRLQEILEGPRYRIEGFGLNSVLKILCAHRPERWPVYNGAVQEAFDQLGFSSKVHSNGEGYERFAHGMAEFAKMSGAPDMIALDAFFRSFTRADRSV